MIKIKRMMKGVIRGINQRLYYIKHFKKGFSFIFLLPGSIRESFGEHVFFKTLTKHNKSISLTPHKSYSILKAGSFTFKFPKGCFYEGDFFDIIYPHLGLSDPLIHALVYENPYYISEGCYEHFGAILKKGDVVIDAGANIGTFSIMAAHAVSDTGKVYAFEPLKEISDILEENMLANNDKNIVIKNDLLGDSNKDVDFYYNLEDNYNASSTTLKKDGDKIAKLRQITLDDFVKDNALLSVDFIKADIEGAERDLLRGAEQTIKRFKPKLAIRTYHLPDDKEVLYNIVRSYVPEYNIKLDKKTLYAWI